MSAQQNGSRIEEDFAPVTAWGAEFGPIGYEMNLLYVAGLLMLALGSPGRLSIDHCLRMRKQTRKTERPLTSKR